MTRTSDIDQIVQDILSSMSLRDKASIANLDEGDIEYLKYAFDLSATGKIGKDHDVGKDVMHRIWKVLQETHRVRRVK